jgi:phospholipid/cholesterol/gamma-HCH transport system substrate-binding protein
MPNTRLAVVGAFVIGGLLLFAFGLFLIGERRMLFSDTFQVNAEFAEIAALAIGAKVRVAGMDAGEVEEIQVPSRPSGRFRVKMRVRKDLHPLIRVDSIASIQNDGLVGNKFVQIQTGTDEAPQLEELGTIPTREPFDIADLMEMMSDTIETVSTMVVEVKSNLDEALDAVFATAKDTQTLMNEIGGEVRTILASSERVAAALTTIVTNVREGRGTVGKLMTDESLYKSVRSMAADAEKATAAVRDASIEARNAIADLRGADGPVEGLTGDVQQTLVSARDAMSNLAEATEALKRNFLFRGFFNRRGYFDLDDVTVAQYREGVLQSRDRRALRIWLDADVLFERDANGIERLSGGGTARLDSAMSQFLRYTPRNPFVVEGYAQAATADARYLISRERAQLVRDYVVTKFKLDVNYVTTMAMGAEAHGSPSGERWNGIGLAVFVPTAEL